MNTEETKELAVVQQQKGINIFGSIEGFEAGQRIAKVFASSSFVPDAYKNNIGNCMIGLNMAIRMNADPLMVLQNLVAVHGTPTFEAKFAIACFNVSGKYSTISYSEVGEQGKDNWGMYAYAIELKTGDVKKGPVVTIKMAKDEGWYARNPKWKNIPELMLRYRAASWFIRTTDPGLMMGFQTKDEAEDAEYVELTNDSDATVANPSAEELLSSAKDKELKEANSQPLDIDVSMDSTDSKKDELLDNKKEIKKGSDSKPQPMGRQEVPDMFKQ